MPYSLLENVSDDRLNQLRHAHRMQDFGQVLKDPPTVAEISSIALELQVLRSRSAAVEEIVREVPQIRPALENRVWAYRETATNWLQRASWSSASVVVKVI